MLISMSRHFGSLYWVVVALSVLLLPNVAHSNDKSDSKTTKHLLSLGVTVQYHKVGWEIIGCNRIPASNLGTQPTERELRLHDARGRRAFLSALPELAKLQPVRAITLFPHDVFTNEDLQLLADHVDLRMVSDFQVSSVHVSDKLSGILGQSRQLRCLDVAGCDITDAIGPFIETLPHLVALNLDDTSVTDAVLASVSKIGAIRNLSLSNTKISDDGVVQIANMSDVDALSLAGTGITDKAAESLGRMTKLKRLDLSKTAVGANTVKSMAKLLKLERLDISGTRISATDAWDLRYTLKHCRIVTVK